MEVFFYVTISVTTVIQLCFWLIIFPFATRTRKRNDVQVHPHVSVAVLICAKNEGRNLQLNLPRILEQEYPDYTVYIVDDGSTDNTREIVSGFINTYSQLRLIKTPPSLHRYPGKKRAIVHAMKFIDEPILLMTDADCYPASEQWIGEMVAPLQNGKEIAIGYSPYEKGPGMLNRFIRYDTCYAAIQYFSLAHIGVPYMGVGRNLAWKRNLFEKGDGFTPHLDLASGDDDLFVNQHATGENIATVLNKDSFVYSEPKKSWKSYIKQRKRHISSSRMYRSPHQYILTALHGSHILHYVIIGIALMQNISMLFVLFWLIIRWFTITGVFFQLARPLNCTDLRFYIPFLDLLYAGFYSLLTPALFLKKNMTWD